MRGCPTLEELQQCDPSATTVWCEAKDLYCKGQVGDEVGQGWFACDTNTQGHSDTQMDMKVVVVSSVAATLVFSLLVVFSIVYAIRRNRYEIYSYYAGFDKLTS